MLELTVVLLALSAAVALAGVVIEGPRDTDPVCAFAAEELVRCIDQAAGTSVCCPDGEAEVTITLRVDPDMPGSTSPEAFCTRCSTGRIDLTGRSPRAVLYAAYDLLERVVGCRFFYPGEDIVPALGEPTLMRSLTRFSAGGLTLLQQPDFDVRMIQYLVYDLGRAGTPIADRVMADMLDEIDWMAKNRLNTFQFAFDHNLDCATHWPKVREALPQMLKRGIVPAMGGHNMHMFMTAEDLRAHPDWGPFYGGKRQTRGQFCTRNEEAVTHYLDGLAQWLRDNPEVGYFAPWPNDTGGWCECELCKDTPMPDRFMQLGKRMYLELSRRAPQVQVTHFAYGSHMEPPATERPQPGMTVTLCTWGRDLARPFDGDGTAAHFRQTFASWLSICREANVPLILHEKYARHLYIGHHTMPVPVMQEDLRWFRCQGLTGFELPMAYMGRRTKGLNLYTLCRLMWDADTPLDELWDDYFAEEYGPLAGRMRQLYESVAAAADDFRYSFSNYSHLGRGIEPGQQVTAGLADYAGRAAEATARAVQRLDNREALRDALWGQPDEGTSILARIDRFRRAMQYLHAQWQSLVDLVEAAGTLDEAEMCQSREDYLARLDAAEAAVRRAQQHHEQHVAMAADLSDLDLHWDVTSGPLMGGVSGRNLTGWLALIVERRKLDIGLQPKRVWQIGAFDGSATELGDGPDQRDVMLKLPPTVRYPIPEDWRDRDVWPDFPRSHWPKALEHGARIELVFAAETGRYRLTVGQIATGDPEIVPVELNGRQVGAFTTVAGKNATHVVEFDVPAAGEHTLALAQFETGGGYMLDALKLERLREG